MAGLWPATFFLFNRYCFSHNRCLTCNQAVGKSPAAVTRRKAMTVHHFNKAVTAAAAKAAGAALAPATARRKAKRDRALYMRDYRRRNEPTVTTVTEPVTSGVTSVTTPVTTQAVVTDPKLSAVLAL